MSQRTEKVEKLAKQVLGEAIQELKDPRVGFATITRVKISADLRHALVWVSVFGSEQEHSDTLAGLRSAAPHLRSVLGKQVRMKYTPELRIELDRGPEEAQHLEEVFHDLHPEGPDHEAADDEGTRR